LQFYLFDELPAEKDARTFKKPLLFFDAKIMQRLKYRLKI